jgi:hypothetical protein
MFHYQDDLNYYRFSWDVQRNFIRLVKRINGEFTILAEEGAPFVRKKNHAVDILTQNASITVKVNGEVLFNGAIEDGALTSGTVALYSWSNLSLYDDIFITSE